MAKQSSASPIPSTSARKRPRQQAAVDGEEEGRPSRSSASSPSPAGYIFMCSGTTKPECYMRRCLGLPRRRLDAVSRIRRGAALFLYDFDAKHLYGPYRADSDGGLDLVPGAFHGRFPAQVKFTIDGDFLPIPESSLRSAIKENYSNGKFSPELALTQVEKLRTLFHPIIVMPESALLHNVDDRIDRHPALPAEYLPPSASHPTQPATNHSMSHTASSPMRERLQPPVEEDEKGEGQGHPTEFYALSPAGFIFMCNSATKAECYRNRVLGLPHGRLTSVSRIKRGTTLFLYDFDAKHLYGPYCAECDGGLALVPGAFQGRFPAQVKFRIDGDFMHIPESSLRTAIKENYSNGKFSPELTPTQVEKLRTLFRPIIVMPESPPLHNVDDRIDRHPALPAEYLPPSASHPTQPATNHSMSHTASSPMRERLQPPVEEDEKGEEGQGHPAEFYASSPAGYIFMCNSATKVECYKHRVLGLPRGRLDSVSQIKRGTTLFLYDFDAKHLYGPYCAECDGGLALVPDAFQGRFPAQVKFRIDGDFMHIPESSLRTAIKENYSNGKFSPELTPTQVEKLRKLFRPIIVMP
ncbi:hypothetical protein GUJ93_ZPchr0011g28329 [Zizania palustris]|uniref:DCD domain-containing protein n=1 Tax=Zizania palustris TaxID=103762 RepID=A0A8J6BRK5_ZIZPA|nr:hypothetical protein GUJ93_ZPchr0011g28329 [Zizania palustris]